MHDSLNGYFLAYHAIGLTVSHADSISEVKKCGYWKLRPLRQRRPCEAFCEEPPSGQYCRQRRSRGRGCRGRGTPEKSRAGPAVLLQCHTRLSRCGVSHSGFRSSHHALRPSLRQCFARPPAETLDSKRPAFPSLGQEQLRSFCQRGQQLSRNRMTLKPSA